MEGELLKLIANLEGLQSLARAALHSQQRVTRDDGTVLVGEVPDQCLYWRVLARGLFDVRAADSLTEHGPRLESG